MPAERTRSKHGSRVAQAQHLRWEPLALHPDASEPGLDLGHLGVGQAQGRRPQVLFLVVEPRRARDRHDPNEGLHKSRYCVLRPSFYYQATVFAEPEQL